MTTFLYFVLPNMLLTIFLSSFFSAFTSVLRPRVAKLGCLDAFPTDKYHQE
jgi:hypothetical protein